jgi:hypothetical protein
MAIQSRVRRVGSWLATFMRQAALGQRFQPKKGTKTGSGTLSGQTN